MEHDNDLMCWHDEAHRLDKLVGKAELKLQEALRHYMEERATMQEYSLRACLACSAGWTSFWCP